MTRKQLILLAACMFLGAGVLASLFALSPISSPPPRQSFTRNFEPSIFLQKEGQVDLRVNSFYLAGATRHTLYLGNWTGPFHLVQVRLDNLDTVHLDISLKDTKIPDDFKMFRMRVDSPYFYLSHGEMPGIFKGQLSDLEGASFLPVNSPYFVEAVPVSPTLFALKSLSLVDDSNELATLRPDSPYFEFKSAILEKQIDGFFCVDGTLHFDNDLNKLVYVYAFRNEYIVMDTGLNVVTRYHTIDTFSRAPIKVAKIASKDYSTLASPPARTNPQSCISKNLLFIRSPLLANNEDEMEFHTASPIDVYDVEQGKYLYSFYLEKVNNHAPTSFKVIGEHLAAIYNHHLVIYKLNLPNDDWIKSQVTN